MKPFRTSHAMRGIATAAFLLGGVTMQAQQQAGNAAPPASVQHPRPASGGPMEPHRPPMEHAFRMGPPGRWWDDPQMAQKLGLTSDQQKKMDDIFLQNRLKLIDQHASVEKEEVLLEPMLASDQPDEGKVLSQIDKIAQSRAELEKANARMLLGLRRVLSTTQWQTLQTLDPARREERGDRSGRHNRGDMRGGNDAPPPAMPPGGGESE